MASKLIRMRCESCGGTIDIDKNNNLLYCPYCGEKTLIMDSDIVKVANAYKDTKLAKYDAQKHASDANAAKYKYDSQKKTSNEYNQTLQLLIIIAGTIIMYLVATHF